MRPWLLSVAQAALYVLLAPLVAGGVRWLESRLQGRRGPDLVQPYRDLAKLARKRSSVPSSASAVFLLAPAVAFTCFVLLGLALPAFQVPAGRGIDLVLVIALLGLARFAVALAAFDAAAPFGPMSSGRQWFIHVVSEPALLIAIYVLALNWHTSSMAVFASTATRVPLAHPVVLLALGALAYVLLAESGRLPFDNPTTHLELTMVEQGSHLEYSGPLLALMEWAEAMKLTFALSLLATLAVPWGIAGTDDPLPRVLLALPVYVAKIGALVLLLALWENSRGKVRLRAIANRLLLAVGALLFMVVSIVVTRLPG